MTIEACDACLRRTALVAALGGAIDIQWRTRGATSAVLGLSDGALLDLAPGDRARRVHADFDAAAARERIAAARLGAACRHAAGYPDRLRELPDPPAVLHVAGDPAALEDPDSVAIVGARKASGYGLEVARSLGRGLSVAGVTVVSGMALGVDSSAHTGALEGAGATVAVLAGGADVPYPASKRGLYARLVERGCVVSELPPGFTAFRWCFPARNRVIAALSRVTVVVEAAERSGSLITVDFAAELGRPVGAVPGQVTSRLAAGTNGLLQQGAALIRDARDVLDLVATDGGEVRGDGGEPLGTPLDPLDPTLQRLLDAVEQSGGS
ncbi:MAG TPA: DNA-processing protein DprA, partial [Solirubrobacteraceae bacterium]